MSNFAWMMVLVLLLTVLGTLALVLATVKFYWGDRGKPPLTGEAKRARREEELKDRAAQIENSKNNPWKTRSPKLTDNSKNSSK